jgi:hypothetical protein
LPRNWYLQARVDQTIRGTPIDLSLPPIASSPGDSCWT